jgi:hypothetical protein
LLLSVDVSVTGDTPQGVSDMMDNDARSRVTPGSLPIRSIMSRSIEIDVYSARTVITQTSRPRLEVDSCASYASWLYEMWGVGEVEPTAPREGAADGMPMRRESLLLRVRLERG